MYFDAFTTAALVDEFMDTLVGGRVQDSIDVDELALGLEIYASHRRQYLLLSGDTHSPRVHLVPDKLRRGVQKPSQLGLMFRRYVEGGSVAHVSQPPWERILQIDIDGPEGEVQIVIEPMERRSNVLLLQNGIVMDCMRRVGPDENRYRVSLPNHAYQLPPPQVGKHDPTNIIYEVFVGLFAPTDDPKRKTHQVLTSRLLGISPLLAKEIVYRSGVPVEQKASQAEPPALYTSLQAMIAPLARREWQPGVVEQDGVVSAYSIYPIESMPGWRPTESLSEAMALYYGAAVGVEAYNAAKEPVHAAIAEAKTKLNGKLISLERSMTDDAEREVLRQNGELILAYQYTLQPGQTELSAAYDVDAPERVIPIDPKMTPLENAQKYFDRYNRAKRALDDVPGLIEDTRNEMDYLAQLDMDLTLATNWPEIDEVQQVLQGRGYWRGKTVGRIGGGKSAPLRVVSKDGFVVWVGRNSRQNEQVTFEKGSPTDLWLHARDVPGAHVIIKSDGRTIPEPVIQQAAELAAFYSAKRGEGRAIVDLTWRKYVKKIKGAAAGMVTYRNEETRTVTPRSEKESGVV